MNTNSSACKATEAAASGSALSSGEVSRVSLQQLRKFGLFVLVVSLCFGKVLWDLALFSWKEETSSHVLLIPFISAYLVWIKRKELPLAVGGLSWSAIGAGLVGVGSLAVYWSLPTLGVVLDPGDRLAVLTFSLVVLWGAGGFYFLGTNLMKKVAFPTVFLIFMVPLPGFVLGGLEHFFQHTSADASELLFRLSGTPVLRTGQYFQFANGFGIRVAQECSGIRSSLVLFMTALMAGHLFLHDRWRKIALVLLVVPLGILRNAVRILTISLLCIHVSPAMIDSPIHRKGGPLFFLLSLVPFFLVLAYLRKTDKGADQTRV